MGSKLIFNLKFRIHGEFGFNVRIFFLIPKIVGSLNPLAIQTF